jgi:hypothetical protein
MTDTPKQEASLPEAPTPIKDGWFEEQEDGTLDYIAVLENGEIWRCKNAYLASISFPGLETSASDEITISYCENKRAY